MRREDGDRLLVLDRDRMDGRLDRDRQAWVLAAASPDSDNGQRVRHQQQEGRVRATHEKIVKLLLKRTSSMWVG